MDGKKTMPLSRLVVVGTGSTRLASVNPRRRAIAISAPVTNRMSVTIGIPAVLGTGMTLHPGSSPLILSDAWFPAGLEQEINAILAVAGESIAVTEFLEQQ